MAISDHPFLAGRDVGTSKRLDQNICLAVTFVDSPAGQWTEKDRAAFLLLMMQGASLVTHTMPGKKLFQLQETVTVPGSFETELSRGLLSSSGLGSLSALSEARRRAGERRYGISFSQAPLLFVFHGSRKSYTMAHRKPGDSRDEYSVFYSRDPGLSPGGIARAILCQFGAVDYSADPELLALAGECFPDGLMLGQDASGSALDPLNRYLVGQTDSLDKAARTFLERSESIARRLLAQGPAGGSGNGSSGGSATRSAGNTASSASGSGSAGGSTSDRSGSASTAASAGGTAEEQETAPIATGHARYYSNYFISGRDRGETLRLKGDVHFIHFFCDHAGSSWTPQAKKEYKIAAEKARSMILEQAQRRNIPLSITNDYQDIKLQGDAVHRAREKVLDALRLGSIQDAKRIFSLRLGCEEAPLVFAFNEVYRSHASLVFQLFPGASESSSIFRSEVSKTFIARTIVHELCHQFGAVDYYYPEAVKAAAEKILPNSVMSGGRTIDDLTAYAIGWTSVLSPDAIKFLDATQSVTLEEIRAALNTEHEKDKKTYGK